MKYYLAPMEGLTTHIFRNAYHRYYTPMDKYFTPFLVPHINKDFNARERRELEPEHNEGLFVVPQILTNNSEDFIRTSRSLQEMGYQEVNLNLGCPSKTVVSKGRGSGFLDEPRKLDRFLEEIFQGLDMKISIKTRLGIDYPAEFEDILPIYNRYPLEELIIHPRVQKDYYKNHPNMELFDWALKESKNPVCYNGDIFTWEEKFAFEEKYPGTVTALMFGRGIFKNPQLLQGDVPLDVPTLRSFLEEIAQGYQEICSGDRNTLFKLKELWSYLIEVIPQSHQKKLAKRIKKCQTMAEYHIIMEEIFGIL